MASFATFRMVLAMMVLGTSSAACAEGHKCPEKPRDHVMLQVSNQVQMTSVAALRLRERLFMRPGVVEEGAALLGVELRPIHRKLLVQLKSAGRAPFPSPNLAQAKSFGEILMNNISVDLLGHIETVGLEAFYDEEGRAKGNIYTSLLKFEVPDWGQIYDYLKTVGPALASCVHPGLGAAVTIFFAMADGVMGLFGGDEPTPLEKLYNHIMKQVKMIVQDSVNRAQAREFKSELEVVRSELAYIPQFFLQSATGVAEGVEGQMYLMWLLMLHRDLRVLHRHIFGDSCFPATFPPSRDCFEWHKQCTIFHAFDLVQLELTVIEEMSVLEPSWGVGLAARGMADIEGIVDIVSTAQWACMAGVMQNQYWSAELRDKGQSVYSAIAERLPALLRLSNRTYELDYAEGYLKASDMDITANWEALDNSQRRWDGPVSGLLQGLYVPHEAPNNLGHVELLAYQNFAYEIQETRSATVDPRDGFKCEAPQFLARIKRGGHQHHQMEAAMCNRISGTPDPIDVAACVEIHDYQFKTMLPWAGCPVGMFIKSLYTYSNVAGGSFTARFICCPMHRAIANPGTCPPSTCASPLACHHPACKTVCPQCGTASPPWLPPPVLPASKADIIKGPEEIQ